MSTVRLVFLGDYCNTRSLRPEIGKNLQNIFSNADSISVDLEGPVGVPSGTKGIIKVGPNLQQPLESLRLCEKWGINVFSLANNHIMDFGEEGLLTTLKSLENTNHVGAGKDFAEAYLPLFLNISGIKIGLLTFAEAQFGALQEETSSRAGFSWFDHPYARKITKDTRASCDVLIVQIHAGLELVGVPLPELRIRYREFIDNGADLIVGHHPHLFQGSETYKGKKIHYSLGNFFLDTMLEYPNASGAILQVEINENSIESRLTPLEVSAENIEISPPKSIASQLYFERCAQLDSPSYLEDIEIICASAWQKIYANHYESALFSLGLSPTISSAKRVLKRLVRKIAKHNSLVDESNNRALLLHNIRIETHRWVAERALKQNFY